MIHKSYGRDLGPTCLYTFSSSLQQHMGDIFFVSRSHPMGLNALQVTSPTYSNVAILPMVTKPK